MKFSKSGMRIEKKRGNDESLSTEYAFQSSILKRHSAGIYGLGTLLVIARNKLIDIIRKNFNKYDACEICLPIVQPKQFWVESNRWDKYVSSGEMFHFEGKNGEYCLAPTAEELVHDFVRNNLVSYKNLNVCFYQFTTKCRDEIRVRGGLLRSKEFLMKDAYSFHANEDEMIKGYEYYRQCYKDIFDELGIQVLPVRALNGDIGGKYSEEMMHFSPIGEDKCLYNKELNIALNIEVAEDEKALEEIKQEYGDIDLSSFEVARCIEVGHIFRLGQTYSKSMKGTFTNKDGKTDYYYMNCYGIGVNRLLASIMEDNCDDKGLIFPNCICPFKIGIANLNDEVLSSVAKQTYDKLTDAGVEVLWHDTDSSIGQKMKDLNLLGVRKTIIIGNNYKNSNLVEIEDRLTGEKEQLSIEDAISFALNYK
ncbi:MAG: aminoacyl--tRNA ligase-related protein [Christensenellales bacterium]